LEELGIERDPDCILVANQLPNLRRFDYKHNFRFNEVPAGKLKGTKKIEYLMLDNACCGSSVVPFITTCPNLNRLELHRTEITPNDLQNIVETNQKIQDIRIRPANNKGLQPEDLKRIQHLPALETLCFGGRYNEMDFDYEQDLAFLTQIPTLQKIVAPIKKQGDPEFLKLKAKCADLEFEFSYY
jgi:hypothetical protein